jgi:hypothetical protein
MQPTPQLSREAYIQAMRRRVEELLGQVADAVNAAAPGQVIAGSEEQVRDLFARLRREAFERAVQMRVDAAEAAFPPSAGSGDPQAEAE